MTRVGRTNAGVEASSCIARVAVGLHQSQGVVMHHYGPFEVTRLLSCANAAVSIFNTKPWHYEICPSDRIELRPDWQRHLKVFDPCHRGFLISCGATLFNLLTAIRVTGHDPVVWLLPDENGAATPCMYCGECCGVGDLLASVEIKTGRIKMPTIAEHKLYEAILRWRADERPYHPAPLAAIAAMESAAAQEGVSLRLLYPRQARKWLRLTAKADHFFEKELKSRPLIAAELYHWHQENRDHWTGTEEDFWLADRKHRFERKPQLMALSTEDDQPFDWLRAGQALQRAILTGTRYGVSISTLPQALERDDIAGVTRRWPWRSPFPEFSEFPQMVMRVGIRHRPRHEPCRGSSRTLSIRDPPTPGAEAWGGLILSTVAVLSVNGTGDGGLALARRSGGFDKGRWPVSWPGDRAGFWPARMSPMWAVARVPLSNPPRFWTLRVDRGPVSFASSRQPPGVGAAVAGAKACAPSRRRERPGGAALKPYRKSSHRGRPRQT
jgi:hypothetical protein